MTTRSLRRLRRPGRTPMTPSSASRRAAEASPNPATTRAELISSRRSDEPCGERESEIAESVLSRLLAGHSLLEVFTPRRETKTLLWELRRDPRTRAILDGSRLYQAPPVSHDGTGQPPSTRSRGPSSSSSEPTSDLLKMVVDYANGMTQREIARKHALHVQTVRKGLDAVGVVTRARGGTLTEADLDEARSLLAAGVSACEVGRRMGVAHTTLLRAIRRADATLFEKATNALRHSRRLDVNDHGAPR